MPKNSICAVQICCKIRGDPLEVRLETARDDEVMRHAGRLELDALEVADLDGMIEQLVVVGCARYDAEAALVDLARCERRRDAPVFAQRVRRRLERDLDRLGIAPLGQHEHARAVEVAAAADRDRRRARIGRARRR